MKIRYLIPLVILVLIFGFTLNSCKTISLPDEESEIIETGKSEEETVTAEDGPESVQDEKGEEIKEEKEALEDLEVTEKEDIRVTSPTPNQVISSPLMITGEARGTWFFEADFPVKLLDGNENVIAAHYATALSDWMTEDFVPFQAEIEFEKPATETGVLILEKDNPSGLPEHYDELRIPVRFE